jgi:uncharacterized protein
MAKHQVCVTARMSGVASKTALLRLVRGLDVTGVREALDESPVLLGRRDDRGRSWLHLACSVDVSARPAADVDASVALAALLVDKGLGHSDAAFTEGSWRATPVWFAVARGRNRPLVAWLLDHGADPGHSLWAAAFNRDLETIDLLLDHGANIDAVTEDETPFLSAVKVSHFREAWRLAERGADVAFVDSRGMTARDYMERKHSAREHFEALARYG